MNRPEKYKIDIVNFMGWREQHFSNNLEALKSCAIGLTTGRKEV